MTNTTIHRTNGGQGPSILIYYWQIFVIANIGDEKKLLEKAEIQHLWISITLGSGIAELTVHRRTDGLLNNKAGYTAQDAPSIRSFHLRK